MENENTPINNIQKKIEELRMAPKHKKEQIAFYLTILLVSIIIISWMAFIGGFSGYFSGQEEEVVNDSKNPFAIIADIFRNTEI